MREFPPVGFFQVDIEFVRGGFDSFPGFIPLRIGHALNLVEAGDCIAHMGRVVKGFFFLVRKCEFLRGDLFALFFVEFAHAIR